MTSTQAHPTGGYLIAEAARQSGVSAANIRFYEKEQLLHAHAVHTNGYRLFSEDNIRRLRFIRRLRSLDMSLDEMRTLLALDMRRKQDCAKAQVTLNQHIAHVRARLTELRALEKELTGLRRHCDGTADQCLLIEALSGGDDATSVLPVDIPKRRQASHV